MFKLEKNDKGIWYIECGSACGRSQDLEALLDAHGIGVESIAIHDVQSCSECGCTLFKSEVINIESLCFNCCNCMDPIQTQEPQLHIGLEDRVLRLLGKHPLNSSAREAGGEC